MTRYIIDVREPFEFMMGHVKGAINIPPSQLMGESKKLAEIPKDAEVVLYCMTGSRSAYAANIMKSMGYTNIVNGINKGQVKAKYNL
jgi:phage shock protein E